MPNLPSTPYLVRRISDHIAVTGDGSSPAWQEGECLSDFSYPWENKTAPRTSFKAVHGERWIYFLFDVDDRQVHVDVVTNNKLEVIDSSRVEIFFRKDECLSPYYCLEMDAAGRVLDYSGRFHRQFDFTWSWPSASIVVKARSRDGGYTVEAAVSKDSLATLGLLSATTPRLQAGLFRAECTHTVAPRDHMRWISWIRPDSPSPDFHIPSAFGVLHLLDY
ncbi:MAG TPA: carbohydrate-binding family 9-like protein [Chryseolinea sp.]|nr:carbohydrate-binding family 9-like protein [Chryseolinea sp.]